MVLYPCLDITCGNTLVILILIIWSECSKSSPLWCYRFFFSLEINKQSLGKYFNIRQIPCSLSKISPKFSIYWWSLPGIVFSIVVADCCFSNSSLPLSQCQHPTVNKNHSDWLIYFFIYEYSVIYHWYELIDMCSLQWFIIHYCTYLVPKLSRLGY